VNYKAMSEGTELRRIASDMPTEADSANTDRAIVSLKALRGRMASTRVERRGLKRLMEDAEHLLETHHATFALDNVTAAREIDAMREDIAARERSVAATAKDLQYAELEHARLTQQNADLLLLVSEKEQEERRLHRRQTAFAGGEKRVLRLQNSLAAQATLLGRGKASAAAKAHGLIGVLGGNHDKVMALEQTMIDTKLELDTWRSKVGLPPRKSDVALPSALYFGTCDAVACVKAREALDDLQARLAAIRQ
jgi:hypothetical protein